MPDGLQQICIEGTVYNAKEFTGTQSPTFAKSSPFHWQLYSFLQEWFAPSTQLTLQTSGSTGKPKTWVTEKKRMLSSAELTCNHIGLTTGDKALLCLSTDYIAGKMMVVRAIVAGLDLYPTNPSSNPLQKTEKQFQLAAMVPLQVYNCLQDTRSKAILQDIDNLLIGGGPIDESLAKALQNFPKAVYATYGMTETLSHIALRRLNSTTAKNYVPFEYVHLWLSEEGTLVIHAPRVHESPIVTNDLAVIHADGTFSIIGRRDNVVMSGGLKIQLEEVEEQLKTVLQSPFALTSCPDQRLGEMLVLVCETPVEASLVAEVLPPHMRPKRIVQVQNLPRTASSRKIDRSALKELACRSKVD